MAKLDGKVKQAEFKGRERQRERDRGEEEEEEGWQINNSLRRKPAGVKFELLDFVSKAIYKKKGQTQVRIFSVLHRSFKRADPIFFCRDSPLGNISLTSILIYLLSGFKRKHLKNQIPQNKNHQNVNFDIKVKCKKSNTERLLMQM